MIQSPCISKNLSLQKLKDELANIFNNKDFNRSMHKNNPLTGDQFSPGMSQETTAQKRRNN